MRLGRLHMIACVSAFGAMAVPVHAATVTIVMENLVISPAEAIAKVGDTLELVNKDVLVHTATARNGDFDVMMPPKQTVTYVLKKADAIDYYCRFHPNMKATLKVEPYGHRQGGPRRTMPSDSGSVSLFQPLCFVAAQRNRHQVLPDD